jgi:ribosomal protein S18 acetylase RimI-like enzyme
MANSSPILSVNVSEQFASWLYQQHVSFAFSTYQTNRLFFVGSSAEGRLKLHERLFDKPMGLYADRERLYLGTRYQIWRFDNHFAPGEMREGCDRLYVPRVAHTTGDLNVHDVALANSLFTSPIPTKKTSPVPLVQRAEQEQMVFVNTDFSCLATLSDDYSFVPIWQPPFISKLVAEDRCHLNGLAIVAGLPAYVTACSSTNTAAGWRNCRSDGGVVMDVRSNEIITTGLSMPHSPRFYQGKLWLLNSGTGEFGYIEGETFVPITFCPGFVRGLAFWENIALVGLSKLRSRSFTGLVLEERLAQQGNVPQCGLMVIDLTTGEISHWFHLEGVVEELFDVVILPGVRQPQTLGLQNDEIQRLVTFPGSKGIVITKPTAQRPSRGVTAPVAGLPSELDSGSLPKGRGTAKIKYQRVYHLNPSNLLPYDELTFPPLSQRWQTQPQCGELIGLSAAISGEIIGFAIAELLPDLTAQLLSLFVLPSHQGQGIGTRMVAALEEELIKNKCQRIWVSYEVTESTTFALEPLLNRLNWQPPQPEPDDFLQSRRRMKILIADPTLSSTPEAEFEQGKQQS